VTTLNQHDRGAASDASDKRNLTRRVWSALALAPIGVAAAYLGGWLFLLVCAVAAGIMLWEWTLLVVRSADPRILVPGIAALLAATAFLGERQAGAAVGMIVIGAVLVGGVMAAWPRRYPATDPALWAASGVVYAGVALLSPALLRGDPEFGFAAILFLFAIVWATDVCAYLIGRAVGGPLLWPQVSPKKTWSGALGGLFGGVAAGTLVAYASGGTNPVVAAVLALVLSIAGQGGDLFESAIKRRFGVKDAGSLIPGHGGVMDRLDGFLVAALIAVLIGVVRDGVAAPGRGLLVW
jgi:phosphatidate cytidylyltransferase